VKYPLERVKRQISFPFDVWQGGPLISGREKALVELQLDSCQNLDGVKRVPGKQIADLGAFLAGVGKPNNINAFTSGHKRRKCNLGALF